MQALWSHAIGPWFDLQTGVRQDLDRSSADPRGHRRAGSRALPVRSRRRCVPFRPRRSDRAGRGRTRPADHAAAYPAAARRSRAVARRTCRNWALARASTGSRQGCGCATSSAASSRPTSVSAQEWRLGDSAALARADGEDPERRPTSSRACASGSEEICEGQVRCTIIPNAAPGHRGLKRDRDRSGLRDEVTIEGAEHVARARRRDALLLLRRLQDQVRADPEHYLSGAHRMRAEDMPEGTIYTCPMHPEIRQDGPGICPICGMALEPRRRRSTKGPTPSWSTCAAASGSALVFTVPLFLYAMSDMVAMVDLDRIVDPALGAMDPARAGDAGGPVGRLALLRARLAVAKTRNLNMFTLIGLGVGDRLSVQPGRDRWRPTFSRPPSATIPAASVSISRPRRSSPRWSCSARCSNSRRAARLPARCEPCSSSRRRSRAQDLRPGRRERESLARRSARGRPPARAPGRQGARWTA